MTPVIDGREQDTELVYIGNIPVMLKSKLCFLSNFQRRTNCRWRRPRRSKADTLLLTASERVIVAMEDLAPNRVIVDIDEKGTSPVYQAKIFSTTVGFRARIELKLKSDDAIYVTMPGVPTEIPFVVIMRALTWKKTKTLRKQFLLTATCKAN